MDRIDKDEELVCPLCGGRLFWMPVSLIYACEHCKQSYSEINGVYMRKKRELTAEESSAVGDAAKLREALKQVNELNDLWFDTFTLPDGATSIHDEIEDVISAALSAPPRNCDRFSVAAEALAEWQRLAHMKPNTWDFRYNYWLFAPAREQEGGGR